MTQPTYDPHNPHPLSQMRSEAWEGKYDEYGQRREVDIAECAMPMQQIEGKVDLIYIAPPLDVGANFSTSVAIADIRP